MPESVFIDLLQKSERMDIAPYLFAYLLTRFVLSSAARILLTYFITKKLNT